MYNGEGNVERTARSRSATLSYLCAAKIKAYFFQGKSAALKLSCKKKSSTDIYFFVALQY
mgnify:CR=1 FL=1